MGRERTATLAAERTRGICNRRPPSPPLPAASTPPRALPAAVLPTAVALPASASPSRGSGLLLARIRCWQPPPHGFTGIRRRGTRGGGGRRRGTRSSRGSGGDNLGDLERANESTRSRPSRGRAGGRGEAADVELPAGEEEAAAPALDLEAELGGEGEAALGAGGGGGGAVLEGRRGRRRGEARKTPFFRANQL